MLKNQKTKKSIHSQYVDYLETLSSRWSIKDIYPVM